MSDVVGAIIGSVENRALVYLTAVLALCGAAHLATLMVRRLWHQWTVRVRAHVESAVACETARFLPDILQRLRGHGVPPASPLSVPSPTPSSRLPAANWTCDSAAADTQSQSPALWLLAIQVEPERASRAHARAAPRFGRIWRFTNWTC